jgi:PhoPQ-activated pathogenicity-related protein
VRRYGARHAWLSITPEPEQVLPAAVAALRPGGSEALERERVESLVLRGSRRAWTAYLAEVADLAEAASPSEARDIVLDVIRNHDNLRLGLP